jgi:peptide-methionine (S)-S-oxide reductase
MMVKECFHKIALSIQSGRRESTLGVWLPDRRKRSSAMTFRVLAATFGIVAALSLPALAFAQDEPDASQSESKAKADGAPKDATPKKGTSSKQGSSKGKATKGSSKTKDAKDDTSSTKLEKATFGGGCFWCIEAVFERVQGVKSAVSGYAGGNIPFPGYDLVSTGTTGHAEVVQIQYDPDVITYEELLKIFWMSHDPTTLNRQGPDEGTQYRSIILYHNDEQKKAARKEYTKLTDSGAFSSPIVTELVPLKKFYPAERYHQDYFRRHVTDDYSQVYIVPKLRMLQQKLGTASPARKKEQ